MKLKELKAGMVIIKDECVYIVVESVLIISDYSYYNLPLWSRQLEGTEIRWSFETHTFSLQTNTSLVPERYAEQYRKELQSHIKAEGWKQLASAGFMPTLGYDPEIFLENSTGEVIPAFMFLPKRTFRTLAFWDGFQAEFVLDLYPTCLAYGADLAQTRLRQVLRLAKKFDKTARFSQKSVIAVSDAALTNASDEHIKFNCRPSSNIYETFVPVSGDPRALKVRFAGGHIHFGHLKLLHPSEIVKAVRLLDAISGVMGVSIAEGFDTALRRQYYGRAGEYRRTPWGLEYRVLSNYWLLHPQLMHLTFDIARLVISLSLKNGALVWDATEEETQKTLNNNDVNYARKLLTRNKKIVDGLIALRYDHEGVKLKARKVIREIIFEGAHKCLPLESIETNWHLNGIWKSQSGSSNCCWETYQ